MNHEQCLEHSLILYSSASQVEVATQCWSLEHQETGVSPIVTKKPVVDLRVALSPPKSASE